ncbi:glycoside hydrolase [Sistotremastrum niveocremeum HHB9708]|uniref:Glycoside hydrolase n=1 Tax=Sistotremastrum niveocremeum HHB9708 TaxID=1314777 RepID=A0A164TK81_9AGAM|nr:glycoside hydrolase [Sistotremastrum niveocremeum HHB9708]
MTPSFLRVEGTKIVDGEGKEIILRGAGLGGWLNMENFITGYPGCEFQIREALIKEIGPEKAEFFWDKFLEYFFTDEDAKFFASLGLNCIRLPFNYHHFEDDDNPRVLKESGFKHLDRVIEICAKHGIYTILDMHTAPGGQNPGWHADHGTHVSAFWIHADFQQRSLWLWDELSKHYASNPWVAGYNPLNEPADSQHKRLVRWYDQVYQVIRKNDSKHILFWDGNTFAQDFSQFGDAHKRWENSSYSLHDYSIFGFPASKEAYVGSPAQKGRLRATLDSKQAWMKERGLCVWNGEWGPVYARAEYDGDDTDAINEMRLHVLRDQLELYQEDSMSWSIWLYKDIGFQGMVYTSRETAYMKLFEKFLAKKQRLAIDAWGTDVKYVRHVYEPLEQLIAQNVEAPADLDIYPWKLGRRVGTLARDILVSDYLVPEWARHFAGKTEAELDELARSFHFDNCLKREGLNAALREHSSVAL